MRESALVVAALSCAGCVDPGGKFDAFVERTRASESDSALPRGDGASCTLRSGDVSGRYVLAISVTLAPTKPILSLADLTSPALDGGVGIAFAVQPLSAADRTTLVGEKVAFGPFPVDANGDFHADLPGLQVTGAANPVTGGDITADLSLAGNLCGDGRFFCGAVTGQVQKPLPLDLKGSTYTLTRVDPSSALPARPAVDCAGTLADPL